MTYFRIDQVLSDRALSFELIIFSTVSDRFRNYHFWSYPFHFKKWPFEVTPLFCSDRNPTIFTYALAQQAPNFRGYNFFQPNECHPRIQLYHLCPNDFTLKKEIFQNFTFVPSLKVTVASFSVCSKFWAFFSRVISTFSRPCNSLYKLLSRISLRMKEKWPSRTVPLTKSSKFRFETFFPLTWTDWWMVSPSLFYLGSKYAKLLDTKNFEGKWKSSNHQNLDPKVRARLSLDNVRVKLGSTIIILSLSAMCGRPREHQDKGRHHSPRYPLRSDSKLSQIARIS